MGAEEIWDTACEKNIPLGVILEFTYRCNLRCKHCYLVKQKGKELSLQEYKSIIGQLQKEKTLFMIITGGEMLLKKNGLKLHLMQRKKALSCSCFRTARL